MAQVREFPLPEGRRYAVKPDHRDGTKVKSQWTVPIDDEVRCARRTFDRDWLVDERGWGLHLVDEQAQYLGVGIEREHRLFVARFVGDLQLRLWHGYPADHMRRIDDRPAEHVARAWIEEGLVEARKVRKLLKGQRCSL